MGNTTGLKIIISKGNAILTMRKQYPDAPRESYLATKTKIPIAEGIWVTTLITSNKPNGFDEFSIDCIEPIKIDELEDLSLREIELTSVREILEACGCVPC